MKEKENIKTRLCIDMDGVVANYEKAAKEHPDYEKYKDRIGLIKVDFQKMEVIENAKESIQKLEDSGLYDMYFATTAPWGTPIALTHKRLWIEEHFPTFKKRVIFTHNKNLLCHSPNDIIIDDRLKNGVELWNGVHIHFGQSGLETWDDMLDILL